MTGIALKRTLLIIITISFSWMYAVAQNGSNVSFVTSDDVVIAGTLWNAGKGKPAVICLHQWRSDRSSFTNLAATLSSSGISVLTIDARGYGESKNTSTGKSVRPDRNIQMDIHAALAYLKSTVAPGSIGLVGASYGSSNAVIFAAGSGDIKALALLSPGLNYFNALPTEGPLQELKTLPIIAIASSEDLRSVEAVKRYEELSGGNISTKIYDNIGHGTDMLDAEKEISKSLKAFFLGSLR
jgi:alpha-beta hydrolase superfamily lysophospholipase